MAKPTLLTVDDDPNVLRAIERDLRSHYGESYRVLRANSGDAGLQLLRELKVRNDAVALLLADQRMPQMDGIGFLTEAKKLYPDSKRALLTAYADTSAAIQAINEVNVHYFFLKPWDPPSQHLYPVLDDLLEDWTASYRPPYEGIRVLGTRWSPRAYEVRDFLARNHVPYQWIDVELASEDPEVKQLIASLGDQAGDLPLTLFPDGTRRFQSTSAELADKIGLRTRAETQFYDLAIIGGGPGGLAAAVYGASEGLKTVMIDREAPGGQAGLSSRIENYLGFPAGLSGADLARRAVMQAQRFGVEIIAPQEVIGLRAEGPYRIVKLANGSEISCHAALIATGVQWRRLDVPGVDRLQGAGVYYGGGSQEAISYKDETVFIVGGANSAGQAALNFAQYAEKVVMLLRGASLSMSMSRYLIDQIEKTANIQLWPHAEVAEVRGDGHLQEISVLCSDTGEVERIPASAMFIYIGAMPRTDWLEGTVLRDERGFVVAGPDLVKDGKPPSDWKIDRDPFLLESSLPGVFVVGDVRHGSIKRVASAVGEGSIAVQFIHRYMAKV
jgi:thioredoxin reductase (NADPH)